MTDPLAELDQTLRSLQDFAKATRTYWQALRDQGFTEQQATEICGAWIYAIEAGK
jgi:hypothetical protein